MAPSASFAALEGSRAGREQLETLDDWSLLSSRAGAAGLEILFERYRDHVFRLSVGFLGGSGLADDAVQEVFLRLANARRPWFAARAKLGTWLYRTTRNVCRELRRRHRREVSLEVVPERPSAAGADSADLLTDLLAALDTLPERQREAVVLRHLEGATTREAAAAMGCREGSVKTHLHRGLAALRLALGDTPGTLPEQRRDPPGATDVSRTDISRWPDQGD